MNIPYHFIRGKCPKDTKIFDEDIEKEAMRLMKTTYHFIQGKYCKDAKIFAENVEEEALRQVYENCDSPAFEGARIRLMPDCHAGAGCNVGFSVRLGRYVNPNHIGVDIGCRMTCVELSSPIKPEDYKLVEHRIKTQIPFGFNVNDETLGKTERKEFLKFLNTEYSKARSAWSDMIPPLATCTVTEDYLDSLCRKVRMDIGTFYKSLGSVGGGNHFIEYGETEDGRAFVTVHCGSRNFGLKVCKYWAKIASTSKKPNKVDIERIKAAEPDKKKWNALITKAFEDMSRDNTNGYLSGDDLKGYLSDMVIATAYAAFNHRMIIKRIMGILSKLGIREKDRIESVHNYIDFQDHFLRKGAIRSYKGEKMIIPFNMRDGIAICEGKSNEDWNYTAPHGAGRLMSRSAAKKAISLEEFKESMEGIYSTTVCQSTVDESPMVYKPMDDILRLIKPTAEVLFLIKPKINIKAADGGD